MTIARCSAHATSPSAREPLPQSVRKVAPLPRRLAIARKSFCRHVRSVLEARACVIQITGDTPGERSVFGCDGMPADQARRLFALPNGGPFPAPGLLHVLSRTFPLTRGVLRITVLRGADSPPFAAAERRTLEGMGGLAGSFIEMIGTVAELSGLWHSSLQALDRLAVGVVLVGSGGEVLATNRTARDIARTHAPGPEHGQDHGVLHDLSRLAGRPPHAAAAYAQLDAVVDGRISILATPLEQARHGVRRNQASTALFLSDNGRLFAPYQEWLCRFYSLTRLEAQLVTQIVEGRSLAEVATNLRVSIHTVRTYLKQIFGKTGVHRQAELVKLVIGGIGQVRADPDGPNTTKPTRAL